MIYMKIPKGGVLSIPLMSGYASLHSMLAMGGAKKRRLPLRYAWRLLSEGTGNPKTTKCDGYEGIILYRRIQYRMRRG